MIPVTLAFPSAPVGAFLCDRFLDRLRGLLGRPSGRVVVIPGAAVHGIGMRRPLRVIGLGRDGEVVGHRLLRPWRAVRIRGARWMVEGPVDLPVPPSGTRLLT